jgi:folate-binding protein YgfZ
MKNSPVNIASPVASDRGLAAIKVSGTDRISLLQGQLTQDMTQLSPDKPLFAGWTNPKGRLICTCWLLDWDESVWLLLPAELRDAVAQRLAMYVLRADVQIERPDMAVEPAQAGTADALSSDYNHPENNDLTNCFYNNSIYFIEAAEAAGLAIGAAVPEGDMTAWRLANIRAGIPTIWAETRETFIPQMLNMDLLAAINFSKGCYVGQEIIARTQNLGRIKRRMYRFQLQTEAQLLPGAPVYADGKTVGNVVDAVTDGNVCELLAVIRIESQAVPLSLAENGALALTSAELPYSVPESI